MPKFPAPYVGETKAEDPIMKRVPLHDLDIGARSSGMPRDIKNSNTLEHVGSGIGTKG
jgi:hypothetical protein